MGPDARLPREVTDPQHVGVQSPHRRGGLGAVLGMWLEIGSLIAKGAGVAVGHAAVVEAVDRAAVVHQVHAVPFDGDRRGESCLGPVVVGIQFALGNCVLPVQVAVLLVQAQEDAAIPWAVWIARMLVVGADVHASAGDNGGGVGLGSQLGSPGEIQPVGGIEGDGQFPFGGSQVSIPGVPPLRLVRTTGVEQGRGQSEQSGCGQEGSGETLRWAGHGSKDAIFWRGIQ